MDIKDNSRKSTYEVRNDADLQAIQTSVAFKNISDAIEQYRRQFGLAFLALIAFSAIHVGLVVIANLYTMETRVSGGVLASTSDPLNKPVGVSVSAKQYDLSYVMTNMNEAAQLSALNNLKSTNFVDREGNYRQYTVTGFQLGGWKRSELKLYTSVGHILEYVRGKGLRVNEGSSDMSSNSSRHLSVFSAPSPPPPFPPPPKPPPPFPPGSKVCGNAIGKNDATNTCWNATNSTPGNITMMLHNLSDANIAWLNKLIASGNAGRVYTQSAIGTLMQAANNNNNTVNVTNSPTDLVTNSSDDDVFDTDWQWYKEQITAEKDLWKGMSVNEQDSVVNTAMDIGVQWATNIANSLNNKTSNSTPQINSLKDILISNYSVSGYITEQQINDTLATFATEALVHAQEWDAALDGVNYWTGFEWAEKAYHEMLKNVNDTVWYNCANRANTSVTNSVCDGHAGLKTFYDDIRKEMEDVSVYLEAAAVEADNNYTKWYNAMVSSKGGEAQFHDWVADQVVFWILDVVETMEETWSAYLNQGYIDMAGMMEASKKTGTHFTRASTDYGCTGAAYSVLRGSNADIAPVATAIELCKKKSTDATLDPYFQASFLSKFLGAWEVYSAYIPPPICTVINANTGAASVAAIKQKIVDEALYLEYVYMLHGFGCTNSFLWTMAKTLDYVFSEASSSNYAATNGFVVIAPADASTPYPMKSWYMNNEFTGFHMDMIVFELREFITAAFGVNLRMQGVFGYSMGGWGSIHIGITYPDQFNAYAMFNSPVKPNQCFYVDTCHAECGIDHFMCELMWTAIGVATNPYVVVTAKNTMNSWGMYSPMAWGNLANIVGNGLVGSSKSGGLLYGGYLSWGTSSGTGFTYGTSATGMYGTTMGANITSMGSIQCAGWNNDNTGQKIAWNNSTDVPGMLGDLENAGFYYAPSSLLALSAASIKLITGAAGFTGVTGQKSVSVAKIDMIGYSNDEGNFNSGTFTCHNDYNTATKFGSKSCPMTLALTWVFETVAWDATTDSKFYLNPDVQSKMSGFSPILNYHTAVRNTEAHTRFRNHMPFYRVRKNKDAFKNVPILLMINCDHNDQFGAGADHDQFVMIFQMELRAEQGTMARGTGWVYDKHDSQGHSFSQRDIRLTIQWMSDCFRTATGLGDLTLASTAQKTASGASLMTTKFTAPTAAPTAAPKNGRRHLNAMVAPKDADGQALTTWGPCYLGAEYRDGFGAYSATQTAVMSGGAFDHTKVCDTAIFKAGFTFGGVFADQWKRGWYAVYSHAAGLSPSDDEFDKHNDLIAAQGFFGNGNSDTTLKMGGKYDCWSQLGYKKGTTGSFEYTMTWSYNEVLTTANPTNCCGSSLKQKDCQTKVFATNYVTGYDCCDSDELASMYTSTANAFYNTDFIDLLKGMKTSADTVAAETYVATTGSPTTGSPTTAETETETGTEADIEDPSGR